MIQGAIEGITESATEDITQGVASLPAAEIAYRRFGDEKSPAIVLVRGLDTQLIDWPVELIDSLMKGGLQVLVFDNRDAGLSQKFTGKPALSDVARGALSPPYTINDMADDIPALMDELGVETAHLLGISMGGMICQVAAANHPARFLSLFSVMSSSGRPGLPGPTPEAKATLDAETNPDATMEEKIAAAVKGLQVCGSPGYPIAEADLFAQVRARIERNYSPDGAHRQMAAIVAVGDRSAYLKQIKVPSLVIHGAADPLIPVAAGEDTAAQIPGAAFKSIKGMGHDLPPALMPEFSRLILEFIDR